MRLIDADVLMEKEYSRLREGNEKCLEEIKTGRFVLCKWEY